MKRLGLLLMLLSIGLFVVGCEQPSADEEKKDGDAETSVTDTPDAPDTTSPTDTPDTPAGSDAADPAVDPPPPTDDPFK